MPTRQTKRNYKKAFTLVELLVVISIIALLLSILMPSLQRARFIAKRVVCFSNARNQYLAQIIYACDNDGKFAPHDDHGPLYVRSGHAKGSGYVHELMKDTYITDSKILLCPLQKGFSMSWSSLAWEGGGWDGINSSNEPFGHIFIGYMWFANFTALGTEPVFKFSSFGPDIVQVNEPAWPKKDSECNARRAFISHDMTITAGGWTWDHGHGGQSASLPTISAEAFAAKDNPVVYSDGHVKTTNKHDIKPRARHVSGAGLVEIYY